jgi:hypothetical protein
MKPKHRIIFKGYYDLHNFGDDLLLLAILDFFHNQMGWQKDDVQLFIEPAEGSLKKLGYEHPYRLFPYLDPIKAKHTRLKYSGLAEKIIKLLMGLYMVGCLAGAFLYRVTGIKLWNSKNIRFFKKLDIVHYIGGGYMNTRLSWGTQFLIYELFFVIMAKLINPKLQVIGTGLGVGPVTTRLYKHIFKLFIANFDYVFVREKESEDFIKSLNRAKHVKCIGDDVLLLLPYFQKVTREVPKKSRFGLNLKFDDVHQYGSVKTFFEQLVQSRQAEGEEVVFFNFGRDHQALRQLPAAMSQNLTIYSCYETGLENFLQHLASSQNCLGFAYHFAILCVMMNIPSANIYFDSYYRQKTGGALALLCNRHVTLPYLQLKNLHPEQLIRDLKLVDQANVPQIFEQLRMHYKKAYQALELARKQG